ncbi:MAG: PQQ-binding-like beta-propeller repeat protein [Candidatus Glassbacteria bacterium]
MFSPERMNRTSLFVLLSLSIIGTGESAAEYSSAAGQFDTYSFTDTLILHYAEPTGEDTLFASSPVIDRYGRVYLGRSRGSSRFSPPSRHFFQRMSTLNAISTSERDWEYETDSPVLSTAALDCRGRVFFCSSDGYLYCLNLEGELVFRLLLGGEIVSSPAIGAEGTVFVGGKDGKLYAVSPGGEILWDYATGGEIVSSPAVGDDGTVYIGSRDGKFYAISGAGVELWSYTSGGAINSSAAIGADSTVYFGSNDGYLYALGPDGSLRWRFATGGEIISSPAIGADGTVYFGSGDRHLYAVSPAGELVWKVESEEKIWGSPIIDFEGSVLATTNVLASREKAAADTGLVLVLSVITVSADGKRVGLSKSTMLFGVWVYSVAHNNRILGFSQSMRISGGGRPEDFSLEGSPWSKFRHDYRNTGNVHTPVTPPVSACDFNRNGILSIADAIKYLIDGIFGILPSGFSEGEVEVQKKHRFQAGIGYLRQLLTDIARGDCLEGSTNLAAAAGEIGLAETMNLDREQLEIFELALTGINLTPEEETLIRAAVYGVQETSPVSLPQAFLLGQNFPNPFNPSTSISYSVPLGEKPLVTLGVFDLRGRLVRTLVDSRKESGTYTVFWDGRDERGREMSSGVYFCRMQAGTFSQVRKMVLLK